MVTGVPCVKSQSMVPVLTIYKGPHGSVIYSYVGVDLMYGVRLCRFGSLNVVRMVICILSLYPSLSTGSLIMIDEPTYVLQA